MCVAVHASCYTLFLQLIVGGRSDSGDIENRIDQVSGLISTLRFFQSLPSPFSFLDFVDSFFLSPFLSLDPLSSTPGTFIFLFVPLSFLPFFLRSWYMFPVKFHLLFVSIFLFHRRSLLSQSSTATRFHLQSKAWMEILFVSHKNYSPKLLFPWDTDLSWNSCCRTTKDNEN